MTRPTVFCFFSKKFEKNHKKTPKFLQATIHKEQEKSGKFYENQRKIHFGGTPRIQYREGGKFYKPPRNEQDPEKSGKFAGKTGKKLEMKKKLKSKKVKGDPVKGTSTEYDQLANSDEDNDVMDVSDMLPEPEDEVESEIPLVNTGRKATGKEKNPAEKKSRKFNALGEFEDVEEDAEAAPAPPAPKKPKNQNVEEEGSEDELERSEGSEGSEEEEDDEDERLKFREEISKMPLGKVKEMKEKLGIKLFNKTYFGTSEADKKRADEKKKAAEKADKGQHRPREMSSKRPVSAFRNIYGGHEQEKKKKKWDPRFDARAGDFKEVCFENNYQFLDEIRTGEMQDLRNEYNTARAEGDEKKAERLKNTLHKMETREKTRAEKRRHAETRKELHDDNIERMLRGEAPIFRTKAQVRRIDAEKKYEELKKDNKLDKYLQRKAKKESAKQKKARPFEGYGFQN